VKPVWANALHQASFGGVEFDCLTTSDSIARAVARRPYPRRNGGNLQDMGGEPRMTTVQAIFFEREPIDGEDFFQSSRNHLERFADFFAATQKGIAQDFVHPLTGTYQALVEDLRFDADADQEDTILVDCTFLEDTTEPAIFEPGVTAIFESGTATIRVQAELLDAEIVAIGLETDLPQQAIDIAELWESSRLFLALSEVNLQLASFASDLNDMMDEFELVTDLARYPVWRSAQRLLFTVRLAADSFRQNQPQLTTILVLRGQPLRALVAEHYGAREAERRCGDIIRLNDIDDPSYIPEGTRLRAPVAEAGRRTSLRRTA
jgi:prophage DNA circulation protein